MSPCIGWKGRIIPHRIPHNLLRTPCTIPSTVGRMADCRIKNRVVVRCMYDEEGMMHNAIQYVQYHECVMGL